MSDLPIKVMLVEDEPIAADRVADYLSRSVTGASDLRGDPALREKPVVFLTAAIKKEKLGGPEGKVGGRTYIAKPLDVQGVIDVIERTIAGR